MFENIYLEPEQKDLFCEMAEFMKGIPREKLSKFLVVQSSGGDRLLFPGYPDKDRRVYIGDLEELARQGLLVQSYVSRDSRNFDITSLGYRYYDQIKDRIVDDATGDTSQESSPPDLNVRVGNSLGVSNSIGRASKPIFLSYAREDQSAVEEITKELSKDGFRYWFDKEDLLPGDDWEAKVMEAIEDSQYVLVFLSPRSIAKTGYFQKEVRYILEQRKYRPVGQRFVIPILLEPCEPPRDFRDIQWLNYWEEGAYGNLKKALGEDAAALI